MNAEALLDVVDESDRVIGQRSRAEVHSLGLRHRSVHILVSDPANRLFVQRRAWWKDCAPGLWDTSVAGHVDAGESYDESARRELAEELGIDCEWLPQTLFRLPASASTGYEFVAVYRLVTPVVPRPAPGEIIEFRWCHPTELREWLDASPQSFTRTFHEICARMPATP
jgi:isopentenyl-diphosphate delta-isomerase type 1